MALLFIGSFGGFYLAKRQTSSQIITNKAVEEKFTGTITDINYQCQADGICTIQIGEKYVIVGKGESPTPEPKGNSSNIELDENKKNSYLGKKVEVFAQKIDNNTYTIYGKTKYYVKLLNQKSEDGKFCGGFAGIECPVGYLCKYDGNYPDASGICVKK